MTKSSDELGSFRKQAARTARQERSIQRKIDRKASRKRNSGSKPRAMQAGARRYPEPKLPGQHLKKPGREADLKLAPMYEAPYYRGSGKLQGMVALITGADSGIGRAVAVLFAREGADVAIAYLNEHEDAAETKRAVENEGRRSVAFSGDVANPAFCRAVVKKTVEELGRLDILVDNAAFQEHVDRFEDLSDEHFDRTVEDESVRLLQHGKGRRARDEEGRLDSDDRVGDGLTREQGPPRLLDDEGRHPCFRPVASHAPC